MSDSPTESTSVSSDEARKVLEPYLELLAHCFRDGWEQWCVLRDEHPALARPLSTRTRANFVNDHIWNAIKQRFSNLQDVHIVEQGGLRTVNVADRLLLRFKKLTNQLRSSNIQTRQQTSFLYQLSIPGIPELTRLTAGYLVNRLQTDIDDVFITYPVGSSIEWAFAIPQTSTELTITPMAITDSEVTRMRRVKVKDERTKKPRAGDA